MKLPGRGWLAVGSALFLACGATEEPPPPAPPGGVAAAAPPEETGAAPQDTMRQDTSAAGPASNLIREVFVYRGAGRDPFRSLIASGDVRPLIEDLRVMSIVYDPRYPARSVAVLRDQSVNRRYDVRVDDELGRLRVLAIRPDEVVFMLEEFGVQRQVSLALRRRQEGVP